MNIIPEKLYTYDELAAIVGYATGKTVMRIMKRFRGTRIRFSCQNVRVLGADWIAVCEKAKTNQYNFRNESADVKKTSSAR